MVPNTELGHLEIDGRDAEKEASEIVREKKGLSWAKWAKRVDRYLKHLEALFWPDLIIIGGGASRKADKFIPLLTVRTPVVAAALQNDAGIVGAAVVGMGDVTRPASRTHVRLAGTPALPAAVIEAIESIEEIEDAARSAAAGRDARPGETDGGQAGSGQAGSGQAAGGQGAGERPSKVPAKSAAKAAAKAATKAPRRHQRSRQQTQPRRRPRKPRPKRPRQPP